MLHSRLHFIVCELSVQYSYIFVIFLLFIFAGDVRPFIRNIFKTHELVDKARNGDRDVLESKSPLHYPALTPAGSSQEAGRKREAGAGAGAGEGATAAAVAADAVRAGESTGNSPPAAAE